MRKLLVTLDDNLANLLAKYPNQNEVVRQSLKLYIGDITPDTIAGIRTSYEKLTTALKEVDSKVDYIASRLQK